MNKFVVGQRWISEAEPELGLGIIVEVGSKVVTCFFSASKVDRKYGVKTAPLRRIKFSQGDDIKSNDGKDYTISGVIDNDGILTYECGENLISESMLSDALSFSRPEERMFAGHIDSNELFKLRYDVLLHQRKIFTSPLRGFFGPRLKIIPHQYFVAKEVTKRSRPRVLLADEVGLGKTIEAGLIIHQLILTGKAERCLIIVPDSLVYQWFVEMLKKFQLNFKTINFDTEISKEHNIFEEGQLFIVSLKFLNQNEWLYEQARSSEWDLLVVDEAHQLRWSPEHSSVEYDLVASLAEKTNGLLLLSGTPEILGLAGHYARLHLLDSDRFHSYSKFLEETSGYTTISRIAKKLLSQDDLNLEEKAFLEMNLGVSLSQNLSINEINNLVRKLVDLHGTGRVFYRNTRKNMSSFSEFFPARHLHSHELVYPSQKSTTKNLFDLKCLWLVDLMNKYKNEKILLICHDKNIVLNLEQYLTNHSTSKVAVFHSGMNLLARDRQASYFADEQGAQILLSTEIGSEGRNFEFAHHLVLFDLPELPDLLEQRIGRLDRIGQTENIKIHVPYAKNSSEEILLKWYHEGFNAFEESPRGGTELFMNVRQELKEMLDSEDVNDLELDDLINKTKSLHQEIEHKLEDGQDKLVELNSYNHEVAKSFTDELNKEEQSLELRDFMLNLWNQLGLDVEDMNDSFTFYIKPGDNMYLPHFPGLENEGMTVTFKRENALHDEKMVFLTWDHPMVIGIMDFISSKEIGNVCFATWKSENKESFLFEGFYLLRAIADKKLMPEKWFPPTPIRVLLNANMQDITSKMNKKFIDQQTKSIGQEKREELSSLPKEFVKLLIKKGKECCLPRVKQYKDKFILEMMEFFQLEITRLEELRKVNSTVSLSEIDLLRKNRDGLKMAMEKAEISLDCIRIIVQ